MGISRKLVTPIVTGLLVALSPAVAQAEAPAPGWEIMGNFYPTTLPLGGEGTLTLDVYNSGAGESSGGMVIDTLPPGLEAVGGEGCTVKSKSVVECSMPSLKPGAGLYELKPGSGEPDELQIPVRVVAIAPGEGLDRATVEGGGALESASTSVQARYGSSSEGAGLSSFDAWFTNADGTADTQAGSHPYELTVAFSTNSYDDGAAGAQPVGGEIRNLDVKAPPGLVGNPDAVPQCPRARFDEALIGTTSTPNCPASSQIGYDFFKLKGSFPGGLGVFNLVPPPGVAAEFGFTGNGITTILDAKVRSGGDYGITEHVGNITERGVLFNTLTLWGVPAEESHDFDREGAGCIPDGKGGCGTRAPLQPFLTLPTSCGAPQEFKAELLGTYQNESAFAEKSSTIHNNEGTPVGFTGCERLAHFNPTAAIAPDTTDADTPAGLTAEVNVPQGVNPEELSTSGLQNTTVTLPPGVVINPGQATGLVACQPGKGPGTENLPLSGEEGEGEKWDGPPECPAASKVGTDEISTPLLPDKLEGNVYILQNNPPHLQLLVAASGDGVNLKLIGEVNLDPNTGQITTTFKKTPDFPFTVFKLSFSGGAQAALATPTGCGSYESSAEFTPWSAPFVEDALSFSAFKIEAGPGGSGCASPLPFAPAMTAGATTDQAGGYTDFTMLLQRGDGQQRISSLQFKTPEGLLGMIRNVPLCREPQAAEGTCSPASEIGHTVTTAGPGPYPFQVPQAGAPPAPIYLTGPYEGAPYGLSIVVPVIAGPFDLGTVIVRAKIEVDPHTAQLTITTGELPAILDGIPTDLRAIDAVIDRPDFMFNPTDCDPAAFSGTATSTAGAKAGLESHFQVGSCQSLAFKPDFTVTTQSKTSKANGASLTAKIVYPTTPLGANQASSQANIASVKVDLPKQLPSRLTTLQKACTNAQFEANPAGCPAASLVGHATAVTPVLPVALTGPAYFVSHGGEAFPSLIVVLQGDGVTVDLVGTTFISKAGITSSTFKQVPDVPIASFELTLPEGKYSALATNLPAKAKGSFCGQKLTMPTAFTGQNGAVIHESTPVSVTSCPKAKKVKHSKHKHGTKTNKQDNGGRGR
jgi:hypothetical protein